MNKVIKNISIDLAAIEVLVASTIDTNKITNEADYDTLWEIIGTQGTPTTAIIGNSKLIDAEEGELSRGKLNAFLKANGIIN